MDGVEVKEGYRAAVLWMDPSITSNRDAIERLSNCHGFDDPKAGGDEEFRERPESSLHAAR